MEHIYSYDVSIDMFRISQVLWEFNLKEDNNGKYKNSTNEVWRVDSI